MIAALIIAALFALVAALSHRVLRLTLQRDEATVETLREREAKLTAIYHATADRTDAARWRHLRDNSGGFDDFEAAVDQALAVANEPIPYAVVDLDAFRADLDAWGVES